MFSYTVECMFTTPTISNVPSTHFSSIQCLVLWPSYHQKLLKRVDFPKEMVCLLLLEEEVMQVGTTEHTHL